MLAHYYELEYYGVCEAAIQIKGGKAAPAAERYAKLQLAIHRETAARSDLKRVLIAGGFGSFIRRSNAQRIGLLPVDIDRRRIQYVGNASLNGAKYALVSTKARHHAEQLARQTTHVQLSEDPDFQNLFAESMIFPEH